MVQSHTSEKNFGEVNLTGNTKVKIYDRHKAGRAYLCSGEKGEFRGPQALGPMASPSTSHNNNCATFIVFVNIYTKGNFYPRLAAKSIPNFFTGSCDNFGNPGWNVATI